MEKFTKHKGVVAVLNRANIDTDQIIPKQFLKSISRTGFEKALFFDWRYAANGTENPSFVLNIEPFRKASILVTGNNFGCGSSREHAVWAIMQFGIRVIIAPWRRADSSRVPAFAEIFRNNSFRNGLLLVELSENDVGQIIEEVNRNPGIEATVNLQDKSVILHAKKDIIYHFEIDETVRHNLLHGLDEITETLQREQEIIAFEKSHYVQKHW